MRQHVRLILKAATRKFLVTTNERKQMSTKTNFKRIALVAVAALGLGILSAVPSSAAVSNVTITVTNGTSTTQSGGASGPSDTTTAAIISVTGLVAAALDSITMSAALKSAPVGATRKTLIGVLDTNTTSGWARTDIDDLTTMSGTLPLGPTTASGGVYTTDSDTIVNTSYTMNGATSGYIGARLFLQLESGTGTTAAPTSAPAGTYVYTVTVTSNSWNGTGYTPATTTSDVSIVVAAQATAALTASAANSSAFIGTAVDATSDAAVSAVATASTTTPAGYLTVTLRNAAGSTGTGARESVTITTTIGQVGDATNRGRSVVLKYDSTTNEDYGIYADGTAGTGTITISTPSVTFPSKSVTFYAVAPATLVASVATPNLRAGTNSDSVRVTAKDANGVSWAGQLYIYASAAADAVVAGAVRATVAADALTCTWDAADDRHECPLTGNAAGTGKFKTTNYATAALATAAASGAEVTSNEVSVVVNTASAATVKIEFDKATYAPGERARIYVTPLDSAGKPFAVSTYANLLATGGVSSTSALTFAGSTTTADSLTAVSITTKSNSSSVSGARAGSMEYTVFMPVSGGTVTISATGGTSLPIAARVAVTASATVTDSGAAALAAVNALATTVASLKTLITTLTNLVLKIQKKVKA